MTYDSWKAREPDQQGEPPVEDTEPPEGYYEDCVLRAIDRLKSVPPSSIDLKLLDMMMDELETIWSKAWRVQKKGEAA